MKKVFITQKLPGSPEKLLREKGFQVSVYKGKNKISKNELMKYGKDSDAMITLLSDKIDKEIIDSLSNCKIIANCAVGINNIDVAYANSHKIIITNTPDILTDATADIAVALTLCCARRFYEGEKMMRQNLFTGWKPDMLLGIELRGKKVGIIGAGRIGCATASRLKSFGTEILYFNRSGKNDFEKELGAKKVTLNYLLKNSDIISLHLPLTDSTYHLLNKDNMKLLKKTCVFINTSRGEVVDEKFLIKLLKQKKIFAAGFDVYEGEPVINQELIKLENVFLLPHIGSATVETRSAMANLCAKNVINVLKGKLPVTPVNLL
jgi:glyoxylate reductase